ARGHLVVGNAPARGGVGNVFLGDAWVVAPPLVAGARIQCDQDVPCRTQVQGVADLERRGLRAPALFGQVAGAVGPDPLEPVDIVGGDLVERAEARGGMAAAVGAPVTRRRRDA